MMTRQQAAYDVRAFVMSWRGVVTGALFLIGILGFDGRETRKEIKAAVLQSDTRDLLIERRLDGLESHVDETNAILPGLALARCLDTPPDNRYAVTLRAMLKCGEREREAGIVRK